jgi:uncharacterized protein YyaL (SSP411 family)
MTSMSTFRFSSRPNRAAEIPWREWDADHFQLAAATDRLVLLSIAPAWHPGSDLLDEGSYSDPRLIEALSTSVVPIRVDAEERPDLAARYGGGGDVVVSLLTPEGEPIARLVEPEPDDLLAAVERALARWRDDRAAVEAELELARIERRATARPHRTDLTPALLDVALEVADEAPGPAEVERVRLWLYAHRRRADLASERRARAAIQRRVDGGGYDELGGGFHHCFDRGCTVRLAEDQGRWLLALARIAAEDSEAHEWVSRVVEGPVRFVLDELLDATGGFHHSVDDERIFAASTATASRGLLACGVVFDRSDWRSRGRNGVDFLVQRMRAGEAGVYHAWDGVPWGLGILEDQVHAGLAFADAYEFTGEVDYLRHAQTIARLLLRQYQLAEGALADTDAADNGAGLLAEPVIPFRANAKAAELLLRLGHLTHDDRYPAAVYAILGAIAGGLDALDVEDVSIVARVTDRLLSVEPEVKVIAFAPPGEVDGVADPLHAEALRLALAAHTVQRLHPEYDSDLVAQLGVPVANAGAVCFVAGEYGPLLRYPDELLPAIERAIASPV